MEDKELSNSARKKIKDTKAQIDKWRLRRKQHGPMPSKLWRVAIDLARKYGAGTIARTLGIHGSTLRDKLKEKREADRPPKQNFVEIIPANLCHQKFYSIELERPDGSRMTMQNIDKDMLIDLSYRFLGQ